MTGLQQTAHALGGLECALCGGCSWHSPGAMPVHEAVAGWQAGLRGGSACRGCCALEGEGVGADGREQDCWHVGVHHGPARSHRVGCAACGGGQQHPISLHLPAPPQVSKQCCGAPGKGPMQARLQEHCSGPAGCAARTYGMLPCPVTPALQLAHCRSMACLPMLDRALG